MQFDGPDVADVSIENKVNWFKESKMTVDEFSVLDAQQNTHKVQRRGTCQIDVMDEIALDYSLGLLQGSCVNSSFFKVCDQV